MKKFFVLIGCLFVFKAFAVETKVCDSVHPGIPGIKLELDQVGMF